MIKKKPESMKLGKYNTIFVNTKVSNEAVTSFIIAENVRENVWFQIRYRIICLFCLARAAESSETWLLEEESKQENSIVKGLSWSGHLKQMVEYWCSQRKLQAKSS